jgi:superfamily II DNA/RNA helicase
VATDLASRGIHVQDIAHVINYDLPEVAENFIHRVGRTGRAGEVGVASTLFARHQRSDLFELERTLGIRMERIRSTDAVSETLMAERDARKEGGANVIRSDRIESGRGERDRFDSAPRPRMVRLPGEVLQIQMES